jgi:hypothetical protein
MELAQGQDLSPAPINGAVAALEAGTRDEAGAQDAASQPQKATIEVASAVATATTAAAQPTSDAAEALRLFRSSLLDMVGAPALYSEAAANSSKEKRTGWLGRSAADDLSCASLIAKYVSLWSVLERPENQRFSIQALIGLRMLEGQNFLAASKVFKEIEFQTSTPAALSYVMRGVGTFITGFLGFVILIVLVVLYLGTTLSPDQELALASRMNALPPEWASVVVASIAGMFGGVVSLLLRISEFESTKGRSQMFLKLTGATLPIVGGLFGAFVASLFCAQIVNITIGQDGISVWAFIAIGFLSGFSERFSRTFVQLAEKRLGGADQATRVSVAANATVSEAGPSSRPSTRAGRSAPAGRRRPARRVPGQATS